jgi:hypothetical protein
MLSSKALFLTYRVQGVPRRALSRVSQDHVRCSTTPLVSRIYRTEELPKATGLLLYVLYLPVGKGYLWYQYYFHYGPCRRAPVFFFFGYSVGLQSILVAMVLMSSSLAEERRIFSAFSKKTESILGFADLATKVFEPAFAAL